MAYIADMKLANGYIGQLVGNGQCVTFIHAVVVIPPSSEWTRGDQAALNIAMLPGTIIASFDANGTYGNHMDGSSHAAVYLRQDTKGIWVLDQWKANTVQPVHERIIRFRHGHGLAVNDGDAFYVVR
jgi:hypothetical protein